MANMHTMANIHLLCIFALLALSLAFADANSCDKVGVYQLKRGDFSLKFTNYGATMLSVIVPDKNGLFLVHLFEVGFC